MRSCSVWLVGACVLGTVPAPAAEVGPRLLLHLPLDGTVEPKVAAGEKTVRYLGAEAPLFEPGIVGQALVVGGPRQALQIPVKGNLDNQRGTLLCWVRRLGRTASDWNLAAWNGPGGFALLYKWKWFGSLTLLSKHQAPTGEENFLMNFPTANDDGAWHLLALAWDGPVLRGYFDGRRFEENPRYKRIAFTDHLLLGNHGPGTQPKRLIDDVRVYAEPLADDEIARLYVEQGQFAREPVVTIPRRTAPIQIDGDLKEGEWDTAAQLAVASEGGLGLTADPPTAVHLCYDDEWLYAAFVSPVPAQVRQSLMLTAGMTGMLRQTRSRHDEDVDHDDAFEINVVPAYPGAAGWYRLVVNALNTRYEYSIAPTIVLGWDPAWKTANKWDLEGWRLEAAVPLEAFGGAKPGPGTAWRLNFFRLWRALKTQEDAWAWGRRLQDGTELPSGWGKPAGGRAVFAGPEAVCVRLASIGPVADGALDLKADILNPSAQERQVQVSLRSDSEEVKVERTVFVPARGRQTFAAQRRLEDARTQMVTFEVTDASSKEVVFRQRLGVILKSLLGVELHHYPTPGLVRLDLDLGRLRHVPLEKLAVEAAVVAQAGQPPLVKGALTPPADWRPSLELDVSKLATGRYTVVCRVCQEGKPIFTKELAYHKRPLPEWYGNPYGLKDVVHKPYTPVQRRGDTLAVWGREYRLQGRLLPSQITSQGESILQEPIRLVIASAGQTLRTSDGTADVRWVQEKPTRVDFQTRQTVAGATIETQAWIEYDGFLWTNLKVTAGSTAVDRLVLEVPYTPAWSTLFNPYSYHVGPMGLFKRRHPNGWKGAHRPLWLGNETGGLQWMTETDATWLVANPQEAVSVTAEPQATVLRVTLVDKGLAPGQTLEAAFGLIATPVRPRVYRVAGVQERFTAAYAPYSHIQEEEFNPAYALGGVGRRSDNPGEPMHSYGCYVTVNAVNANSPDVEYWVDEWSPTPQGGLGPDRRAVPVSPGAASYRDYFTWWYRENYRKSRCVGLYWDCAPDVLDSNHYHGGGVRVGSAVLPKCTVLAGREICKRLWCMLRELEPDETQVIFHRSGQWHGAFMGFVEVHADGENFTSVLSPQEPDYHRVYPPDAFRAMSMGHNLGPWCMILDELTRSGVVKPEDWKKVGTQSTDHFTGLIMLHDSVYWRAYGNPDSYKAWQEALKRVNFGPAYTRFIPYWNQTVVKLPENLFASFYVDAKARRTLGIFLNNNEDDRPLRLEVDWKALGYEGPAGLKATSPVYNEPAAIEGGSLVFTLGRANARMIVIEPASAH